MRLMTAHRVLIAVAVAFFLLFGAWELWPSSAPGAGRSPAVGLASLAAAMALTAYAILKLRTPR